MITKKVIFLIVLIFTSSATISAEVVKEKAKKKFDQKVGELSLKARNIIGISAGDAVTNFAKDNSSNLKYLDFDLQVQENLKPTFNVMSVTEMLKIKSGTIFNQTSLNTYDEDQTINIGFGVRKLLYDSKIILGSNVFFDHQFQEAHQRSGLGVEAISSIFDLRGNYYNAISDTRTTNEGTERALDGWDTQLDYHLPGPYDINLFANAYKFENSDRDLATESDYKEKGNKFGANAKLGNFLIEAGYLNDNKENDAYFGSIRYVLKLANENQKKVPTKFSKFVDISDKLYQPVKRENKIRVVKISKSGVQVGGF